LCFRSLAADTPSLVFPCDAGGHVDMDALSDAQRELYLYARTVVGRVFAYPELKRSGSSAEEDHRSDEKRWPFGR